MFTVILQNKRLFMIHNILRCVILNKCCQAKIRHRKMFLENHLSVMTDSTSNRKYNSKSKIASNTTNTSSKSTNLMKHVQRLVLYFSLFHFCAFYT